MKKILITIATSMMILCTGSVFAQKIGHINSEELMKAMPETDSAQTKLQAAYKELQNVSKSMEIELQTKVTEFQNNQAQYSELIKSAKYKEITDLQTRIEEFQQQATEDMKEQQTKLLGPIMDKAKKAIQDVAKEHKYSYILDTSMGIVLYSEDSDNVLPLVKQKLGLKK